MQIQLCVIDCERKNDVHKGMEEKKANGKILLVKYCLPALAIS